MLPIGGNLGMFRAIRRNAMVLVGYICLRRSADTLITRFINIAKNLPNKGKGVSDDQRSDSIFNIFVLGLFQ